MYIIIKCLFTGLLFCLNENDEEFIESSVDKDELTAIPFTGWTTEQGTIEHNIACTLMKMPKSDRVTCKELIGKFEHIWNEFLEKVSSSLVNYLSLEHLGIILHNLAESNSLNIKRNLAAGLKQGVPNLIVCPQGQYIMF
ncbi:hypothetical protein SNE40_019787 [Patella caerulea]|uniref:Uncharacterized protein n=1 Tax=Patella caerulea TaxID=87958 RepID=A0AAN8IZ07_PATCE